MLDTDRKGLPGRVPKIVTVGPVSTCRRELLRGWWRPIGFMVSLTIVTASDRNILDTTLYLTTLSITIILRCYEMNEWLLNVCGPGTPPALKWLVWFTDGSRTADETGAEVYGQSADRRFSIYLGKHATVFQAEVYAILACVNEIETQDRSEKYVSICSDSQADLKALQAAKTKSPWYDSARRRWMVSLPDTLWGYIGSLDMPEWEEMKSPTSSQGKVLFNGFLDLSLSWGSLGRI
jgi:hypothetical protein